jgi:hypothetical protein
LAKPQKVFLKISDIIVQIRHSGGSFSRAFLEDYKPFQISGSLSPDARLEILEKKKSFLPPKAVLSGRWPELSEEEYKSGSAKMTVHPDGMVMRDYKKRRVKIVGRGQGLLGHARTAAKWLILKTAEGRNHAFIHASAVRYQGKNLVFAGDSGSGKTSFMLRLARMGAEVICDDALLARRRMLIPFLLKFTEKGDFKKRFAFSEQALRAADGAGKGIDFLVFPKIWNHASSRLRALARPAALKELDRIYQKEAGWNAYLEPRRVTDQKYRELIRHAKCFEFYAGRHEKEVRRTLKKFLEREVA